MTMPDNWSTQHWSLTAWRHARLLWFIALIAAALLIIILLFALPRLQTALAPPPDPLPHGELRVGVDPSVPPFAVDTGQGLAGVDIDLGNALGEVLNVPVRFVPVSFDGLYDALYADQVDVLISALRLDPNVTQRVRYTRAYFDNGLVLVSSVAAPVYEMRALADHTLAYEFGSSADLEARRWTQRIGDFATRPYELPRYALDAVRLGHADAALVDATSYFLYGAEHPQWQTTYARITADHYLLAVRADHVFRWQVIDGALKKLLDTGRVDAILNRWFS